MVHVFLGIKHSSLAWSNAVGNPHLTTQDRQEDNHFNGIHIMDNHYQLRLLVFHQGGNILTPA